MMPIANWDFELLPPTKGSSPVDSFIKTALATATSKVPVFLFDSHVAQNKSRPGHLSIGQVMEQFEADPEMARAMAAARTKFSKILAPESPSLHHLRLRAGLSQKTVANMIGTSQSRLSLIEQGKTDPGFSTVEKLVTALNCSRDEFAKAFRRTLEAAQ